MNSEWLLEGYNGYQERRCVPNCVKPKETDTIAAIAAHVTKGVLDGETYSVNDLIVETGVDAIKTIARCMVLAHCNGVDTISKAQYDYELNTLIIFLAAGVSITVNELYKPIHSYTLTGLQILNLHGRTYAGDKLNIQIDGTGCSYFYLDNGELIRTLQPLSNLFRIEQGGI